MLNKVMIIGRLGRDPELRYTPSGMAVANFSVATDESYTDKEGTKQEKTEWHRISVFARQAETCSQYLAKGSLVYVEGRLQSRKWQDPQGQDRTSIDIRADRVQFLDRKGERGSAPSAPYDEAPQQQQSPSQSSRRQNNEDLGPAFPSEASSMDDIPF